MTNALSQRFSRALHSLDAQGYAVLALENRASRRTLVHEVTLRLSSPEGDTASLNTWRNRTKSARGGRADRKREKERKRHDAAWVHTRKTECVRDIYGAGDTRMETNAQDSLRSALDNCASARPEEKPPRGKNVPAYVYTKVGRYLAFLRVRRAKIFREYAPRVPLSSKLHPSSSSLTTLARPCTTY